MWARAGELIDDAQRKAGEHAAPIPVYCSGPAIDTFTGYVKRIYASSPSGATAIGDGQPLMENLSAGCRLMSKICHEYADAIETCRHTLIALGVTAGIVTAAGIALTIFTFGGSDAAAAAGDAAIAADAAVAADALATAETELAAAAAVAEAESIIAAELAKLGALGVITAGLVVTASGVANAGPNLAGLPAAMPAVVPPLPPIPADGTSRPTAGRSRPRRLAGCPPPPTARLTSRPNPLTPCLTRYPEILLLAAECRGRLLGGYAHHLIRGDVVAVLSTVR